MNPIMDNNEHVKILVYTSEGEKYGSESVITSEIVDGMGHKEIGNQSLRMLLETLDEAYDREFYWEKGDIETRQPEKVWEKVKNINTDDELMEIKHLLGIRDED